MFNQLVDIDRRIEDLQRLKNQYQQPITNIIQTGPTNQSDFKAQYLKDNEKVEDILVNCKTAFISLKEKKLIIKETTGDYITYGLVLPKDEKDKRIEELERRLKEYEYDANNKSNSKIRKSSSDAN